MSADIVHAGHMNIIARGNELGDVVVGLLTDEAIAQKKRLPFMEYAQRYSVISSIRGVTQVIPQPTPSYVPNLRALKPDYVVHGDDWSAQAKKSVLNTITTWGGELVEVAYTEGVSSTDIQQRARQRGVSPLERLRSLKRLLHTKATVKALEAHNGLSALIVENTRVKDAKGHARYFDAIWISSLTDSSAKGKPDTELIDNTSRLATINEVIEVTTKPIILDGDSGGHPEHFAHTVRTLERLGVSAIVIEDKTGLKRNSLHSDTTHHQQEAVDTFSAKIRAGVAAKIHDEFMVIARIESLILGKSQQDALLRAKAYIAAGASAIMIHSKDASGSDIKTFCLAYNKLKNRAPLMLVPTSYNGITDTALAEWGANIVVHANHLIRAAYPAMAQAAEVILQNDRSLETESFSISVNTLLKLPPGA